MIEKLFFSEYLRNLREAGLLVWLLMAIELLCFVLALIWSLRGRWKHSLIAFFTAWLCVIGCALLQGMLFYPTIPDLKGLAADSVPQSAFFHDLVLIASSQEAILAFGSLGCLLSIPTCWQFRKIAKGQRLAIPVVAALILGGLTAELWRYNLRFRVYILPRIEAIHNPLQE